MHDSHAPESTDPQRLAGDDQSSWTVVPGKNTRRNGRGGRRKVPTFMDFDTTQPEASYTSSSEPCRAKKSGKITAATVAHIQEDHQRFVAQWKAQPYSRRLEDLIASEAASHSPVTQAVCLGAGTFGGELDSGEHIRRAHVQTHAFLSIVACLSQHSGKIIPCFFQEPLYTEADKMFLQNLGHDIVERPDATKMINSSTLVYGIHLPTRAYLDCLSEAFPAILIGTSYDKYEVLAPYCGEEACLALGNLHKVNETFSRFDFPHAHHDYCFSDTSIYWNKPAEDVFISSE